MRTLTAPQTSLLAGAHRAAHTRVRVANSVGFLIDYSDYLLPGTVIEEGVDELVNALTLHLDRSIGESSLSPLMSADPPIALGREVVFDAAVTTNAADPVAGDWFEMFRGSIRSIDPTHNDMVVVAEDQAGALQRRRIKVAGETYGANDGSETLEAVIAELLDRWGAGVTLYTPVASEAGVTEYTQQKQTLLEATRALAESIGWTARYWWDDVEDEYRFTLMAPPRGKTDPDWIMKPSRYLAVRELKQDVEDIFNSIEIGYIDAAGATQSLTFTDPASIAKYDEIHLPIFEGTDSPIKTAEQVTALGQAILSDLSEPDATHAVEDFLLPHLQLWDLLEFEANGVHYSTDQRLAVMAIRHEFPAPGVGRTVAACRGKPSGGVLMWRRRAQAGRLTETTTAEPVTVYSLNNFREIVRSATHITYGWEPGPKVAEVWIHNLLHVQPVPSDPWPGPADLAATVLPAATTEYQVAIPVSSEIRYLQFEPRTESLSVPGNVQRVIVGPNKIPTVGIDDLAITTPKLVDSAVNAAKLADAAVIRAKILDGAVNDLKLADLAVTNAKVAVDAISSANLQALAVTAAKIGALAVEEAKLAAGAVTAAKIGALAVEEAKIAAGAVTEAKIGAAAVTTAKLANLAVTEAILAAAAVTVTKIADNSISTPKLQAGSVVAAKIAAGTITSNEIAANTIVAGDIAAGTITGTEIAAATITGAKLVALTITSAQIAAGTITGTEIAGNTITAAKLVALTITAAEIAAGTITGAKIASDTITAGNIAAATITGSRIAALTIEAGNIAAGTITAAKIAANTITAAEIAANAITADELSANAVTAAKILAGAVTAGKIAADAVTANEIDVSTLSAISANLGIVRAGYITNASGANGTAGISLAAGPSPDWTRYFDLSGAGAYFIFSADFTLDHSGNGVYGGALSAATGTFSGTVTVDTAGLGNELVFKHSGSEVANFFTVASAVTLSGSDSQLEIGADAVLASTNNVTLNSTLGNLNLIGLPGSNPGGSGRVWNDGGFLMIT